MTSNRRVWVLIVCLLGAISLLPAAAQSAPRAVQVILNAANNNKSSAFQFSPNAEMTVTGVENATIEGGESQHSCLPAASAGSKSVWFEVFLVEGLVTLSTAGTSYGTGGGNSPDSVMSIYFGSNFTTFGNLVPVACNDNGSGAAVLTNVPIPVNGNYLIQVSASTAITVTAASQVNLVVTHVPDDPASNNEPGGAKSIKFPANVSLSNMGFATVDLNEPADPALADPLYNTVWFTFTKVDESPTVFQQLNSATGAPTLWFSIYTDTGAGLAIAPDLDQSDGYVAAFLSPGTYYLRVGQTSEPEGIVSLTESFITLGYLMPNNFEFSVDRYENTNTSGLPVADLNGWSVKNGDVGETAVCDPIAPYNCYFVFTSSGALESTQLKSKLNLVDNKIKKGDILTMNASVELVGDPDLAISVKLVDASGAKLKFGTDYDTDVTDFVQYTAFATASLKPVKAVVKFKNNDTDFGDTVRLDSFAAGTVRVGEFVGRFTPVLSGLKLELPDAWSAPGGADVLPVPAAPSAGWR
ncbi:MAG: hypothetical protein IPM16_14325 [Chloroflexi bacterium]|nr:hypothetical protein [Chloroflexota bacterium]